MAVLPSLLGHNNPLRPTKGYWLVMVATGTGLYKNSVEYTPYLKNELL
jgi:hypothetical protein